MCRQAASVTLRRRSFRWTNLERIFRNPVRPAAGRVPLTSRGEGRKRRRKIQPGQSVVEMMHACFHGGGSGSRITKSVAAIRDLTKSMKAMTLKVKGGGRRARARRRRRATEDEDPEGKDASSSASSSAKIAPAQPHEDEEEDVTGEKHEHCDKCLAEEEGEGEEGTAAPADGEWMAEPEPGVLMTLAPRGDGANYLRRIRFSEDHFPDACAAHEWWAHNYDRIVELYSLVVQSENASHREEDDDDDAAAPVTPCQSEDDEHQRPDGELEYSASCSASASGGSNSNFSGPSSGSGSGSANKVDSPILGLVTEPNSTKRSPQAKRNHKAGQDSRTLTLSEN
ncbi:hypothetical protein QOZ80_4BG0344860 [Eleusine coracana subsp. coracana]|nr:hypothetical protein QOZ80_4BG0344860 [Eleusine coracana subsp. coracana]